MNNSDFTLDNNILTGHVSGDAQQHSITINFSVTSDSHDHPVIDMAKYNSLEECHSVITAQIHAVAPSALISDLNLKRNGIVEFSIDLADSTDYTSALNTLRQLELPDNKMPAHTRGNPPSIDLDDIRIEYDALSEGHPEIEPKRHIETARTRSFTERLTREEAAAELRHSLKVWKLDGEMTGMNAAVFPVDKSLVTGHSSDENTKMIAIRITPGIDTKDPRSELYRMTSEIEKRLITRDLDISRGDIYLGVEPDGSHDTGVVIIKAGKNPLETLERVNAIMEQVQEDYAILSMKLGSRYRGEDYLHRSTVTSLPARHHVDDPMETKITATVQAAIQSGMVTFNGSDDDLSQWVKTMVADARSVQDRSTSRRASGR